MCSVGGSQDTVAVPRPRDVPELHIRAVSCGRLSPLRAQHTDVLLAPPMPRFTCFEETFFINIFKD